MAHEIPILNPTFKAGADLSAKTGYLAKLSTSADETVLLGAANSDVCIGVISAGAGSGLATTVMVMGISKCIAGGTITRGDAIMSDTAGKGITATGTNPAVGYALESSAANRWFSLLVFPVAVAVNRHETISFQLDLASVANGNVFTFTPGYAGTIVSDSTVVNVPATTAAKATTLTTGIGATATTGGAMALTSANMTPMGAEVKGTAITALNVFTSSQTVTVIATSTTAFVEGTVTVLITLSAA